MTDMQLALQLMGYGLLGVFSSTLLIYAVIVVMRLLSGKKQKAEK